MKYSNNIFKHKYINNISYITPKTKSFKLLYRKPLSTKAYNIIGKTKFFPYTSKEWKDTAYTYNKNYLRSLPVKHNIANKLIKNYFYISNQNNIARSHRMRSLIRKSSTKKLFISKPHIKHNNDKVIVTIYNYDRERQSFIRNLFFIDRKYISYTSLLNNYKKKIKFNNLSFINNGKKKIKHNKLVKRRKNMFNKNFFHFFGINFSNETNFFRYKMLNVYNKLLYLDHISISLFLYHILSIFKIKVIFPVTIMNKYLNKEKKNKLIDNLLKGDPEIIIWMNIKNNTLRTLKKEDITKDMLYVIIEYINNNIENKKDVIYKQELLNHYLWIFLKNNFINTGGISINKINLLYKNFKFNNYKSIIFNTFKNESRTLSDYIKLELNNFKLNNLLFNLKFLFSKIYNKYIELNIVNLKYINLNSDIYTQAIVTKLRKKISLLKVLRKSLKLIKLPYIYLLEKKDNLNNMYHLNIFKSLHITNSLLVKKKENLKLKDYLIILFEKLFPYNLTNKNISVHYVDNTKSKIINILNTIKYKWISGVRLEAAGRLTRRNTASRSAFKIRYKGSLKNTNNYFEANSLKSTSAVKLRNHFKANSQYTLIKSKRRIGSFGIKSWISSY